MNYGGNLSNMHDSGSNTPKYGSTANDLGPVPPYRTQAEANAQLVNVTGNMNVMNPPPPRRQTGSKAPRQRVAGKSVNRQTASKSMPQNQNFGNQLPTLAPEINQSPYYTNYNTTSNNNQFQQVQQVAENALLQQLQQQQQQL